jgi:hypothetical protein
MSRMPTPRINMIFRRLVIPERSLIRFFMVAYKLPSTVFTQIMLRAIAFFFILDYLTPYQL